MTSTTVVVVLGLCPEKSAFVVKPCFEAVKCTTLVTYPSYVATAVDGRFSHALVRL